MDFEFAVTKSDYREKTLGKDVYVVLPTPARAPDWRKKNYSDRARPGSCLLALIRAKDINEATRVIDDYLARVEKAILEFGWGSLEVKIGKGKTDASRCARVECWMGQVSPDDEYDGRVKVNCKFFVPASIVAESDKKGYGFVSQYFVTKKLEEISERSVYKSKSCKRVPVALPVCPPGLLAETKKRIMDQLPL